MNKIAQIIIITKEDPQEIQDKQKKIILPQKPFINLYEREIRMNCINMFVNKSFV